MNAGVALCRCCGQPLAVLLPVRWDLESRIFSAGGKQVQLHRQEALFFDVMFRHRNRGPFYDARTVFDAVYAGDPTGGPDCLSVVGVMFNQIRGRIEPMGWTITRHMGRPRRGYRLMPMVAGG